MVGNFFMLRVHDVSKVALDWTIIGISHLAYKRLAYTDIRTLEYSPPNRSLIL